MERHGRTNLTEAVRSVQLLKIDGYCATEAMSCSDFIKSRWNVDGHDWEVHPYPRHYEGYAVYWVALKLNLISEPRRSKCTITVIKEVPDVVIPAEVPLPSSDLLRHLGELLLGRRGADVTFVLDSGESFTAHKNILAARSPVFMAEFFGQMNETRSQSVRIEDVQAAVFKVMLHFIYTDMVPELDVEPVAAMAQHLPAAADRYGLDRLKLICEGKLAGGIDIDTAATTLALAEQHNCSLLKSKCVEFIARSPETLDAVLASDGYRHLVESCPMVLAQLLMAKRGSWN